MPFEIDTAHQTGVDIRSKPVDDAVVRPRYATVRNVGKNIVATLSFPSLYILKRHIGCHIHVTAITASMTDSALILLNGHGEVSDA